MLSKKYILGAVVATSLTAANIAGAKLAMFSLPLVGSLTMPAGFVGIAVAFLATDILSEEYGKETAHNVVNGAVIGLAFAYAVIYSSVVMGAAPFYQMASEYNEIMTQSLAVVLASIITLFVSQNTDVFVFHKVKEAVPQKYARNIVSTSVSQLVDTVAFITLAFAVFPMILGGNVMGVGAITSLIIGQYIVKVGIAVVDTPFFYLLTR